MSLTRDTFFVIILFEEFSHGLGATTNGVGLPLGVSSRWVSCEELRSVGVGVKTNNKR